MISRTTLCSFLVSVPSLLFASQSMAQDPFEPTIGEIEASGTFAPAGPPLEQPVRVDAGGSCVIDLRQSYDISGTLSGSLEIDYRIIVYSPCVTAAPGKYDEQWIAHGVFTGTIDGATTSTPNADVTVRIFPDADHTFRLPAGPSGWPITAPDYLPTLLNWLSERL